MTVFVLGGDGFIGQHVCRAIAASGHESVVCVGRRELPRVPMAGIEYRQLDVDVGPLASVGLSRGDAIVHLASSIVPRTALHDEASVITASAASTMALAREAAALKARCLVLASSGGTIYGPRTSPASENDACMPEGFYAVQKLVLESLCRLSLRGSKTKFVSLRVSNPFGPGQRTDKPQGLIGHLFAAMVRKHAFLVSGDGTQVRDYVDVRDVAEAFRLAVDYCGEHQVFNVGSGIGRSVLDVIRCVERVGGSPLALTFSPCAAGELRYSVLDPELSMRELGWRNSRQFEVSLGDYWEGYLEELK